MTGIVHEPQKHVISVGGYEWYHAITFPDGETTTPREDYSATWSMIRRTRDFISYKDKRVLDIASWDGMWAFEAEALGASYVVATDIIPSAQRTDIGTAQEKFLYARNRLNSHVVPYYDRSVHRLVELLPVTGQFDIVQNLGLMYHLENPWHAFKQCRRMLRDDGHLLLETACDVVSPGLFMRLNRGASVFYERDAASYWAPTLPCLFELLRSCFFEPSELTIQTLGHSPVDRVSLVCSVLPFSLGTDKDRDEFFNDYRTAL